MNLNLDNIDATVLRRQVRNLISEADAAATDFYVRPPFCIDCSDDAVSFVASTTSTLREIIINRQSKGKLNGVGALPPTAKSYAIKKLKEYYETLDKKLQQDLRSFLDDWSVERDRKENQESKNGLSLLGVEIILPLNGITLPYGFSDLSFL